MEDRREKDKGLKTGWLWTITAVLALLCCAAIYVDCVLGRLYPVADTYAGTYQSTKARGHRKGKLPGL